MIEFHYLKTWPEYYAAIKSGAKKVEIRSEADRNFKVGDILVLEEYDPESKDYSGERITAAVTHCLRGLPWVPAGYVVMSIIERFIDAKEVSA